MTIFDEREHAFEAKFAHDEEMAFRARARRNRLLGLWAAGLLGKSGAEAGAYAEQVVAADLSRPGAEVVIRRVAADLSGHATEAEVRARLAELNAVAQAQLGAD